MPATTLQANVDLTPELLAETFWSMTDDQQAKFFSALANQGESYHRELQWHFLEKRLREPGMEKARDALMSLAAPLYFHTLCFKEAA